jgi:flagellar biosynthesis protein FliR
LPTAFSLSLDLGWLAALVLLATRLAAFFLMTPLLAGTGLPAVVRLALIFGLAIVLVGVMPAITYDLSSERGLGRFIAAVFTEFALGATLALGVQLALAMFTFAGRVLDVQIGFGIAQVVDPLTNQQLPILSAAFYQLAPVAFFVGNVHHTLLRGMATSIERFPVGQPWTLSTAFCCVAAGHSNVCARICAGRTHRCLSAVGRARIGRAFPQPATNECVCSRLADQGADRPDRIVAMGDFGSRHRRAHIFIHLSGMEGLVCTWLNRS